MATLKFSPLRALEVSAKCSKNWFMDLSQQNSSKANPSSICSNNCYEQVLWTGGRLISHIFCTVRGLVANNILLIKDMARVNTRFMSN